MLFKTIDDIKKYLPVTAVFAMVDIQPFINRAERFLVKQALGQDLYDTLNTEYNGDNDDTNLTALLPYAQEVIANYAYLKYIPHAQVLSSKDGMHIYASDQKKSAYKWMVADIKKDASDACFESLEGLLKFLEINQTDYPDWVDSSAYTLFYNCIITTAGQFDYFLNIKESRRFFLAAKYLILRAQQSLLIPVMGKDFFDDFLAQIKSGDILTNVEYLTLYPFIGPSITNQVMADAFIELPPNIILGLIDENYYLDDKDPKYNKDEFAEKRTQCLQVSNKAANDLREFIYANHTDYPIYEASDEYTDLVAARADIAPGKIPGSSFNDSNSAFTMDTLSRIMPNVGQNERWNSGTGDADPTIDSHIINLPGGASIM